MDGWISLHRKVMNHAVFSDPRVFRLFVICLLKVTYVTRSIAVGAQKVELQPGQFVTGRDSLANEYNMELKKKTDHVDARTIWRWVKWLESWGCLSCSSSNKFTVITVVNWAEYQDTPVGNVQQNDQVNVQLVSSTCPTDVQPVSTNNKEIKKQVNKSTNEISIRDDANSLNDEQRETLDILYEIIEPKQSDAKWIRQITEQYPDIDLSKTALACITWLNHNVAHRDKPNANHRQRFLNFVKNADGRNENQRNHSGGRGNGHSSNSYSKQHAKTRSKTDSGEDWTAIEAKFYR